MTEPGKLSSSTPSSPTQAVHYNLKAAESQHADPSHRPLQTRHTFSSAPDANEATILKRRQTRATSFRTVRTVNTYATRRDWHPGQEPGLDPSKPNGGRPQLPTLHADCDITVVDYSEDNIRLHHLDNNTLPGWLDREGEKADWVKCRWINVNGLSWDVIQALGKYKNLHKLALEDLLNTRNRTKADWYSDHTYIVLTLQKLVHIRPEDEDDDEEEPGSMGGPKMSRLGRLRKMMHGIFGVGSDEDITDQKLADSSISRRASAFTGGPHSPPTPKLRTLQRYHGGHNSERIAFMEDKSALTAKNLAVCAEQVSIFLASDNTIISFFESSAEDIEMPILSRLSTPETILRRSCDASMLTQAIVDAIIDLAIPVTRLYEEVIGELELEVLTQPDLKHTKSLYIVTSEITTMRNFISPITSLVNVLRDHKSQPAAPSAQPDKNLKPATGIEFSAMTRIYLGDVEDHCILIVSALDQMHASAAGMIDLIFNTISAYQNESMKQLTVVTIIFLPMSFLTGYFGMNLHTFPSLDNSESYFWSIALPVAFVVMVFLMRNMFWRWGVGMVQRWGIRSRRKGRLRRDAAEKKGR